MPNENAIRAGVDDEEHGKRLENFQALLRSM